MVMAGGAIFALSAIFVNRVDITVSCVHTCTVANFQQVTLGHEDVEFFDLANEATKDAAFNDDLFASYVLKYGVPASLEDFSRLHRVVANQLILAGVTDRTVSAWAFSTCYLCVRLKRRRNFLRKVFSRQRGSEALAAEISAFDDRYPRAIPPVGVSSTQGGAE